MPKKKKSDVNFSICHWNLNSIAAHNYAKVFLLKAYIVFYKFYIICISKTYLNISITPEDGNLCYNLIRSTHSSKSKRGDICIYFKSALRLRVFNIYYLQESINFEFKVGDKICHFISLYRSPS